MGFGLRGEIHAFGFHCLIVFFELRGFNQGFRYMVYGLGSDVMMFVGMECYKCSQIGFWLM